MADYPKNRRSFRFVLVLLIVVAVLSGALLIRAGAPRSTASNREFNAETTSTSTTSALLNQGLTTTTTTPLAAGSPAMSVPEIQPQLSEPKIDPKAKAAVADGGKASVVVVLDVTPSGNDAERGAQVEAALDSVLAKMPVGSYSDVSRDLTVATVPIIVDGAGLESLAESSGVALVKSSREFSPIASAHSSVSVESVSPSSTGATTTEGANVAWAAGKKGAGSVVAVVDTGVDVGHPFFAATPKTIWEACFAQTFSAYASACPGGPMGVTDSPAPGSGGPCGTVADCAHGTHVAGIAVGGTGTTPVSGIAPAASLVAINVFSVSGLGKVSAAESAIINSLQWLYNKRALFSGLSSVNLSVGDGSLQTGYCDSDPLKPAIDQLAGVGISTVIAAGNEGRANGGSSPGCISSALTVGAIDDTTGQSTSYSNDGPQVDVMAGGQSICSAIPSGSSSTWPTCLGPTGGTFRYSSGTSMATPAVSGAIAVMAGDGIPHSEWKPRLQRVAQGSNCVQASAYTIPTLRVDVALGLVAQAAAPCAPSAPSAVAAGGAVASVSWLAPISSGSGTLLSYTATASSGQACTVNADVTSCTISNLPVPASVTFSVRATSTTGTSGLSVASNVVRTTSTMMVPITPGRFADTRPVAVGGATIDGLFRGQGPVGQGSAYSIQVVARGGVPSSGVSAVALNVTVDRPSSGSFLTVYPNGYSRPNASNLNFGPGQTVANMVIAQVGSNGSVTVYNNTGSTDVIVDVVGWFPQGNGYSSMVPTRYVDTRVGPESQTFDGWYQGSTGPVFPEQTWSYKVAGRGSVPASGVAAVAINVTIVGPTDGSFLTVFPTGAARPTASNLNFIDGQTVPNMAIVAVGQGGAISVYNHRGATNVVIDVVGWFASGPNFSPLVPERFLDTRFGFPTIDGLYSGSGALTGGATLDLPMTGRIGIPASGVSSVALNVTVVGPTVGGYLTVFPSGGQRPNSSNVNFESGSTVPNMVICGVGANGKVSIFSPFGVTNVIVDVVGWFP